MVLHAFHDSNHDRGPDTHVVRFLERNGIPYHYLRTTKENKREEEIALTPLNGKLVPTRVRERE